MLMMPLLGISGRRAPATLVADVGLGANYSGTQAFAVTSVTLTVNPDGSWAITFGSGDTPAGTPTTGTWANEVGITDAGADFEVQFTNANEVGSPTVDNDASSFAALTSAKAITVRKTEANASSDITVNFRPVGSTVTALTETSNFAANGA